MSREFLSNAVLLVALNFAIKAFYLFGIDRTVQNALPNGEYGLYFTLFNFAFIFQIINDFGLQNYNSSHLARSRHLLVKYFPHLVILKLMLAGAYLLLTGLVGYLWGFSGAAWALLLLVGLNQTLQSGVLFLRSNLSGLGKYRADSFFSVLDRALLILITSAMLWGWPGIHAIRIEWFAGAQTLAYGLTLGLGLALLSPHLRHLQWQWNPAILLNLLRRSAPYALVVFLMTFYTRLDAVMIEKLLPDGLLEADRYASAYRLLDAANVAGFLVAGLLLPMFARLLAQKEPVAELVRLGFQTLWAGAVGLAAACWFFQQPIMEALYASGDAYSGRIMGWLMLSFVPMSVAYVHGSLLTAQGKLGAMNKLFALGVVVNLCLNYVLIRQYGALGAAQATFITQGGIFITQLALAVRQLELRTDWGWVLRLLGFALAAGVSAWAWQHVAWDVPWVVKFVLAILTALFWAFPFRLIALRQWLGLISRK